MQLVLLSKRIDPSLFDSRLFKIKVVSKDNFLPDFMIKSNAFFYCDESKQQQRQQLEAMRSISKRFARVYVLVSNPLPFFQSAMDTYNNVVVFMVPGDVNYMSTVLQSILPLVIALSTAGSTPSNDIRQSTMNYATDKATETFTVSKSLEALGNSISLSTGVEETKIFQVLQTAGSLQSLSVLSREMLRDQYYCTTQEAAILAKFFSSMEVEAPTYM
jgi:hypothetical protein|tara:strand:+ start:35 stop:685 length:651 start_codon:yes stop_codon:yes gene_type:complete